MTALAKTRSDLLPDGFPATGFLRLADILAPRGPLPISKSTWWAGVAAGRFPPPIKLGPRTTVWRVEDLRVLITSQFTRN